MSADDLPDDPAAELAGALAVPEEGWAERIRTVVLGTVGAAPIVGSPAASVLSLAWQSRYEKRVHAFLAQVIELLRELDARVDNIEDRVLDDTVVSVAYECAIAAGRHGDPDKIRYLANALGSVVADATWSARNDFALILTRLVTELTATHIQVLDLLSDPEHWLMSRRGTTRLAPDEEGRFRVQALFDLALPEIVSEGGVMYAVLTDLESRGFLNAHGLAEAVASFQSEADILKPMTTPLGEALLAFIQDPTSSR